MASCACSLGRMKRNYEREGAIGGLGTCEPAAAGYIEQQNRRKGRVMLHRKGSSSPQTPGKGKKRVSMITEKGFLQTTTEAGTSQKGRTNRRVVLPSARGAGG